VQIGYFCWLSLPLVSREPSLEEVFLTFYATGDDG